MPQAHYPITQPGVKYREVPPSCYTLGKPLWTSEGWDLGQVNDWKVRLVLPLLPSVGRRRRLTRDNTSGSLAVVAARARPSPQPGSSLCAVQDKV